MTHMNLPPSRRDFLKASALGVAGAGVGATAISSRRAAADMGAKSARQKAAHRQRRVIYSDDGATLRYGEPTLKSYLSRRLDHVVDTQVDTVYFNTTMWDDRYSHYPDPKVGEFVLESATPRDGEWFHFANRYRMLAEKEGKDVLLTRIAAASNPRIVDQLTSFPRWDAALGRETRDVTILSPTCSSHPWPPSVDEQWTGVPVLPCAVSVAA